MKINIIATYEGSNKDYTDIETDKGIIKEIPFFDKNGNVISYDEALELYHENGLSQDIWDDDNYLKFIENFIKER